MFKEMKFTTTTFLSYIVVLIGAGYGFILHQPDSGMWIISVGCAMQTGKQYFRSKVNTNVETKIP